MLDSLGFHLEPFRFTTEPFLTVVNQLSSDTGYTAAQCLLAQINNQGADEEIVLLSN